nr:hypothetical protein CFP56_71930 [Quercus suber]
MPERGVHDASARFVPPVDLDTTAICSTQFVRGCARMREKLPDGTSGADVVRNRRLNVAEGGRSIRELGATDSIRDREPQRRGHLYEASRLGMKVKDTEASREKEARMSSMSMSLSCASNIEGCRAMWTVDPARLTSG